MEERHDKLLVVPYCYAIAITIGSHNSTLYSPYVFTPWQHLLSNVYSRFADSDGKVYAPLFSQNSDVKQA